MSAAQPDGMFFSFGEIQRLREQNDQLTAQIAALELRLSNLSGSLCFENGRINGLQSKTQEIAENLCTILGGISQLIDDDLAKPTTNQPPPEVIKILDDVRSFASALQYISGNAVDEDDDDEGDIPA
jgi:hypothetical protein